MFNLDDEPYPHMDIAEDDYNDTIKMYRNKVQEMGKAIVEYHEFLKQIPPSSLPTSYRIRRHELIRKGTDNGF